MNEEVPIEL